MAQHCMEEGTGRKRGLHEGGQLSTFSAPNKEQVHMRERASGLLGDGEGRWPGVRRHSLQRGHLQDMHSQPKEGRGLHSLCGLHLSLQLSGGSKKS